MAIQESFYRNAGREQGSKPTLSELQSKNETIWTQWMQERTPSLLRHAQARLADSDRAEEAVQETWTTLYRKIGQLENITDIDTYVHGILRNIIRAQIRLPEHGILFVQVDQDDEGRVVYPAIAPDRVEDESLEAIYVNDLLEGIDSKHRQILLDISQDLSLEEIAKRDGISKRIVSQRRFKAISALKVILVDRGGEEEFSSLMSETYTREKAKAERKKEREKLKKVKALKQREKLQGKGVEEVIEEFRNNNTMKRSQSAEERYVSILRLRLTDDFVTYDEIARSIGCSKIRVQNDIARLIRLGYLEPIVARKPKPEQKTLDVESVLLNEWIQKDISFSAIAKLCQTGLTVVYDVYYRLVAEGKVVKPLPRSIENRDLLIKKAKAMKSQGCTHTEIARTLGRTRNTITKYLNTPIQEYD